jgi:hypothetical protein
VTPPGSGVYQFTPHGSACSEQFGKDLTTAAPGSRSRALFSDPDGNSWMLQEITTRLSGRIDSGVTSFGSVTDLGGALRRAEAAHGEHEKRTGVRDANWADWYAAYMAAEQAGTELPT